MSYYHDSTRTILDDVMYETTQDLGMAQASKSEDQDGTGNLRGRHAEESHGHIADTEQTTSPFMAHDQYDCDCTQEDEEEGWHAHEKQLRPCVDESPCEKGGIEGHEHRVHNTHEQDIDDPREQYEKMMQHIDDVLVYIDRSIERNTLSMTVLSVTTMIGFTILSGLMLLTWTSSNIN
jgi:hypothetical protein